jgi:hypothetical protein
VSGNYGNTERCSFRYTGSTTLSVEEWGFEAGYDGVKMNGGSSFLARTAFPMVVSGITNFAFSSDHSVNGIGFKICESMTTQAPTSLTAYTVTTVAGTKGSSGSADGAGVVARFNYPTALAIDPTAAFALVADPYNSAVRRIDLATWAVTTVAGTKGSPGSTDGSRAAARFMRPYFVAIDPTAGAFALVADIMDHAIRRIDLVTWAVTTVAGTKGSSGLADGSGAAARFNNPMGVAIDPTAGVFALVADYGNSAIRHIDLATRAVTTVAGTKGSSGMTDGTGIAAQFNNPTAIVIDPTVGTFALVTDEACVRSIDLVTWVVTTVAGTKHSLGTADGTGVAARFNGPSALAIDPIAGAFALVADYGNTAIRRIDLATWAVTTVAGTKGSSGTADGVGAAARFNKPIGVAIDPTAGAFALVTDTTPNDAVRRIVLPPATPTPQPTVFPTPARTTGPTPAPTTATPMPTPAPTTATPTPANPTPAPTPAPTPLPTPTPVPNECNPANICNVCSDCCQANITDGTQCDRCVDTSCTIITIVAQAPTPSSPTSDTGLLVGLNLLWSIPLAAWVLYRRRTRSSLCAYLSTPNHLLKKQQHSDYVEMVSLNGIDNLHVSVLTKVGARKTHRMHNMHNMRVLYHLTSKDSGLKIALSKKMLRGGDGWVGGGIYFAATADECRRKTKNGEAVLIKASVHLGKVKTVQTSDAKNETFRSLHKEGYDSVQLVGPASGDEFIVYNSDQVERWDMADFPSAGRRL